MSNKRIIKTIKDGKGREIYVEVSEDVLPEGQKGEDIFTPMKSPSDKIEKHIQKIDEVVCNASQIVLDGFDRIEDPSKPTKVALEFGLELGGEGNIWFIAKGKATASLKVSVEWDFAKKAENNIKGKK